MKYFGFLTRFVVLPLVLLGFLTWRDVRRGKKPPENLSAMPARAALLGHVAAAVAYTTPWDNYLVKTRVWWYDRKLVTGIVLGYVPIEEYTFFVLQTILAGTWMLYLIRHLPASEQPPAHPLRIRIGMMLALGTLWLGAVYNLLRGPGSRTYLSLTLSWALPSILFQVAFGGDILWQHRRLVALGNVPTTLYLSLADSLAINSGTWTINPEKTVNVHICGRLPLEEGLFFLLTNTLVSFGMTLVLSKQSQARVPTLLRRRL
jgi:lycopene cyclase domain-containing protein